MDWECSGILREPRDIARFALGTEQVHERRALRAVAALDEVLALAREGLRLRQRAGRLDAVDDPPSRELAARLRLELAAEGREQPRVHAADALADIARHAQRPPLA